MNWLEMFCEPYLAGVGPSDRPRIRDDVAEAARADLYKDGKWFADYRRIRVIAVKM